MIGKLNHVAIVVPDLDRAMTTYRDALGATVSEPIDLPTRCPGRLCGIAEYQNRIIVTPRGEFARGEIP